jgi:uncharacterized protein with ParB-like and HNH nuclease domain
METTKSDEFYDQREACVRKNFNNGDVGFYYQSDYIIFKTEGQILFRFDSDGKDYIDLVDFGSTSSKLFPDGKIVNENIGDGTELVMDSHLRFYKYSNGTV